MTITGMAKELNVSTMTIYRRCKKNGVALDELRDSETGELTASGVAVIASLFDVTTPQTATTGDATQAQHSYNGMPQTALQGPGTASDAVCAAELAELRTTVAGLRELTDQLRSERDALRDQVKVLGDALAAEQADRQAERRMLTGPTDQDAGARRGLWALLRRR